MFWRLAAQGSGLRIGYGNDNEEFYNYCHEIMTGRVVMLRAVGHPTGFLTAFASFIIASVLATLLVVPGGLGTFEGASVAMLHLFGVPLAPALAATLLLRGFTFWLPMLPGLWLARKEMFQAADPLERREGQ